MQELWGLVLQASFYGSIVGGIILLSKIILKDNLNAKYHYLIWLLLIVKLIVPFGPESSISLFNKVSVSNEYKINSNYDESYIDNIETNQSTNEVELPNNTNISTSIQPEINSQLQKTSMLNEYFPIVWIIVCINILAVFIISYFMLHKTLKKENKNIAADKYEILRNCKIKMNVNSNIKLIRNDSVKTPSLVGLIKPKIVIPSNMINLSDKELEYIFLHELSHYKRKDILTNYILIVLQSIHWFNPIIWHLFKKMREDMELATDERVLKIINENEHKDYGKAILTVLEKIKISKKTLGVIGMIDDKKTIKKRINMIKNTKFMKNKKLLFSVIGIALMVILSSVLLTSAKVDKKDDSMDYVKSLYEHKTPYIGNASNVVNLLSKLPFKENYESMELQTQKSPYGLKAYYKFENENQEEIKNQMYSNAVIIFALIENVDKIEFEIKENGENYKLEYNREDIDRLFNQLIYSKSDNLESFNSLITYLNQNNKGNNSLDEAISKALINSTGDFPGTEVYTQGHVILDKEEKGNTVKVYMITSTGGFGFENGIFTIISGTSCLPTVMTFEKDSNGNFKYSDREILLDGSYYEESIKNAFPQKLWKEALDSQKYLEELTKQQEEQAKVYLKSINREAKVQGDYVDKELADINVEAGNKLLEDKNLYSYPYWIGSREEVIDGQRYVYEKDYIKKDNEELVIYTKKKEGKTIEEYKYKIVGENVELIK